MDEQDCPNCHGEGTTGTANLSCWKCQGTGVIRVKGDHLRPTLDDAPKEVRRMGRPVGSKNKPKEIAVSQPTENTSEPASPSIVWWTPIVRTGGREPIVRITDDGTISISRAVFGLLGIDPKERHRFRMGNSLNNTLVLQFAPTADAPESAYPWRLNRDQSVYTRPVEQLQQIALAAGRYRVKVDVARRLVVVSPDGRIADGAKVA